MLPAQDYINNLGVSKPLVLNTVADRMRSADAAILDTGDPNRPLGSVYIWRSRQDDTRYSRFLVGDYTPALGERIVVENTPNAIHLTVAAPGVRLRAAGLPPSQSTAAGATISSQPWTYADSRFGAQEMGWASKAENVRRCITPSFR